MNSEHFLSLGQGVNINFDGIDLYVVRVHHTMAYTCSIKDRVILDRNPCKFLKKLESYLSDGERGLYLNG